MILHINNSEYDYHALVKVAEMAGLAGLVGFHESEDGYIVSFPDTENTQALINDYKARLRDLEKQYLAALNCFSFFCADKFKIAFDLTNYAWATPHNSRLTA